MSQLHLKEMQCQKLTTSQELQEADAALNVD